MRQKITILRRRHILGDQQCLGQRRVAGARIRESYAERVRPIVLGTSQPAKRRIELHRPDENLGRARATMRIMLEALLDRRVC